MKNLRFIKDVAKVWKQPLYEISSCLVFLFLLATLSVQHTGKQAYNLALVSDVFCYVLCCMDMLLLICDVL